ncbi:MAG: MotA/TolQ/ExbB proton channel family protein [Thermoguttaceae bacterium]|nr:MotA/TolQ/ExbB proton channel family protein [Thermoguttaceae bacterium]MBQ6828704.1 MotA/TolQ/ExbB proton channel family protein [Thermoguttaceae bacterium]
MVAALTQIFYTISAALLIPVELGLLAALFAACWSVGRTLREGCLRRSELAKRQELETLWTSGNAADATQAETLLKTSKALGTLGTLAALSEKIDDEAFVEKTVAELQNVMKERCERADRLVKTGPALGLMGTLIPLGPALLGLAKGDLETLATNLVVAFSTTVVGLTVALISSWVLTTQKRRFRRDVVFLNFALDRLSETAKKNVAMERVEKKDVANVENGGDQ